jgi:hypothetical protein
MALSSRTGTDREGHVSKAPDMTGSQSRRRLTASCAKRKIVASGSGTIAESGFGEGIAGNSDAMWPPQSQPFAPLAFLNRTMALTIQSAASSISRDDNDALCKSICVT